MMTADQRRTNHVAIIVGLIAFAWFWIFRSNVFTGGDSEQWEREIYGGIWFRKRQMLSFATMQTVYSLGKPLLHWTAHRAINLVSCMAGGVAMGCAWLLLGEGRSPWPRFLIVATAGFTALFCGHIETYAQPTACLVLHLLSLKMVLSRRWPVWAPGITYLIFAGYHLVALFALPVLLFFLWIVARPRTRREVTEAFGFLVPLGLFLFAIMGLDYGGGELVGPRFVVGGDDLATKALSIVSNEWTSTKLHFIWWACGVVPLVAIPIAVRIMAVRRRNLFAMALIGYFCAFLGFFMIWRPDAGPADWDLFTFPWTVLTILLARHIHEVRGWKLLVIPILVVSGLLFIERPYRWSELITRTYGSIITTRDEGTDFHLLLLDDRTPLGPELNDVKSGSHTLLLAGPEKLWIKRPVVLVPDGTLHVHIGRRSLKVQQVNGGS